MALRWFLIGTQYRQPISYSRSALDEASDRLYYIYDTLRAAQAMIRDAGVHLLLSHCSSVLACVITILVALLSFRRQCISADAVKRESSEGFDLFQR